MKRNVKKTIIKLISCLITVALLTTLTSCGMLRNIMENIAIVSTPADNPSPESPSPDPTPKPTPVHYTYSPDPDEVFPDEAAREAAAIADGPIGEGYRALSAYPDNKEIVVKDYDPALHPKAYSVLSGRVKSIYDTVYGAVSTFGTYHYNELDEEPGFMSDYLYANDALKYDYPELFMYYTPNFSGWDMSAGYFMPENKPSSLEPDVEKVKYAVSVYNYVFNRIIEKIPEGISNYQKCIYLCAVISGICTYDYLYQSTLDSFPPYGTLIKGCCVCKGYAETFMHLAQAANIECDRTWGIVYGEQHVWNRVQTSKGELYIDPTWTDNVVERTKSDVLFTNSFFMMTTEDLEYNAYTECTNTPDFYFNFFD